jgi:hypothetical protein
MAWKKTAIDSITSILRQSAAMGRGGFEAGRFLGIEGGLLRFGDKMRPTC